MAAIFYFSSLAGSNILYLFAFQEVAYHFIIYLILTLLLSRALKNSYPEISRLKLVILVVAIAIIYAITDEFHQIFVPGRSVSSLDLFIDSLGSFVGSIALQIKGD